jgi:Protein of unknown function (DUF2490)
VYSPIKHIFVVLFFVSHSSNINAQKNITHQQSVWFTYLNTLEFNRKIYLNSELVERRFVNPNAQHQFAIRERLHFIFNPNFDLAIGFAYFIHSPNDPLSSRTVVIPELRPLVELNYKQIFKKLTLTHRFRTEHRFFRNTLDDELAKGYNSNWRFRYQFGVDVPIFKFKNEQALGLKIGDELFINAGKNIRYNTFDQNRLYCTLTYSPVKSMILGIGFINWFQQRSSGVDYYERDILRFSFTHKIKLNKS